MAYILYLGIVYGEFIDSPCVFPLSTLPNTQVNFHAHLNMRSRVRIWGQTIWDW